MAGHSKFKKIKHKKGAQDAKRSNIFTKIIREITVAVKSGANSNPDFNSRLRVAIMAAREENMPKEKIEAAIGKASSSDSENYDEMRYEGYGPAGTALIVDVLTDNRNRAATEIRTIFGKNGGHLAEAGSVSYMFKKIGFIIYLKSAIQSPTNFLNDILEIGADDYIEHDDYYEILCQQDAFHGIKEGLERNYGPAEDSNLEWRADNIISLSGDDAAKVTKLLDALDDSDDVQSVFYNFEVAD